MSVNKVTLIGRLGKDPDLKYTPGAVPVCKLLVATSESYTDKQGNKSEKTEWHTVIVWNKLAELCAQYLKIGRQVYVSGSIQTRSWTDNQSNQKRYTTEIIAKEVQFLGDKQRDDSSNQAPGKSSEASDSDKAYNVDDIPF